MAGSTYLPVVARFVAVFVLAAAGLRVLDAVPRAVTGLSRGAMQVGTLRALTPAQRRALPVPRLSPEFLEWPPRTIVVFPGGSVAASVAHRTSGTAWLVLAVVSPEDERLGSPVLAPATILQDAEMVVAGTTVRIQRVQDRAGALWHQTTWRSSDTRRVLRYRGGLDELIRATSSLLEGGRR